MKTVILSFLLFISSANSLHAEIPFSRDMRLGVNYSIFFSGLRSVDQGGSGSYPYYLNDFNNLKNCSYLNQNNNPAIKLFNDISLPAVIDKTDKEIFLGIDNVDLAKIAGDIQEARKWVAKNEPYMVLDVNGKKVVRVKAINVGNEIFAATAWDSSISQNTPQAMRNIIQALKEKNLQYIKVTTTTCCATAANPRRDGNRIPNLPLYEIPPTYTGGYEPPFIEVKQPFKPVFKEILKIIAENDSFLSINLYPPFAIQGLNDDPNFPRDLIPTVLNTALFKSKDANTGNYMVEDMIRGYDFAIKKLNVEDNSLPAHVDYVISEIGWPRHVNSPTDSNNYVSVNISKEFYQGLKTWAITNNFVRKLDKYIDPEQSYSQKLPIFMFSFRDERLKDNIFEKYWGIFTDDATSVDEMGLCSNSIGK